MFNVFTFDIETIPDVASGRKIFSLSDNLSDEQVAEIMFAKRREKTGNDFLSLHLQRVCAISVGLRSRDSFKVWTLGSVESDEKEIVQRFYDGIAKFTPTLVSWNGGGFDLPVLHYRGLLHGVQAPSYWDVGDDNRDFKWNNYISRYHWRHTDVMDVLASFNPRANAPLDEVATMLGFPGKMGMSGDKVWEQYLAGNIEGIRGYCETDVLNTHLVYLRFLLIKGTLSHSEYDEECQMIRESIQQEEKPHLNEFLVNWH